MTTSIDYEQLATQVKDFAIDPKKTRIEVELTCKEGHSWFTNVDHLAYATCEKCREEQLKIEQDKELEEIVAKIKANEDINLYEFERLDELAELELRYEQMHSCHKCSSYSMHVHYKGKCFTRTKRIHLRGGYEEEEDWEEQESEDDDRCGGGDYDVGSYDLRRLVEGF